MHWLQSKSWLWVPGSAISSGLRGKKSIFLVGSFNGALDHDVNQKGSLIPSV